MWYLQTMHTPAVVLLADRQLRAYNCGDIEAFCACYTDDVAVLDADGQATMRGMVDFRRRYADLFAGHSLVHGDILSRMVLGPHLVELEAWQRQVSSDAPKQTGQVLVRYTVRDGRIGTVQFLGT